MRTFTIDTHALAALELNPGAAGEPIVLLHGVNLSPRVWLTDELFRQHGPCVALTLPGHYPGALPARFAAASLTPELIADLLAAAIRRVVGERAVTAVGNSTGGFAALALAARHPALVRRVVCISGFATGRWTGALGVYQDWLRATPPQYVKFRLAWQFSRLSRSIYRNRIWPYLLADRASFQAYPRLEEMLDVIYDDHVRQTNDTAAVYFQRMPDLSIAQWLPQISAPTLVLHGEADPIVPVAQALSIAAHVPRAELVTLPGAGHVLVAERTSAYTQAIDGWLRRTG